MMFIRVAHYRSFGAEEEEEEESMGVRIDWWCLCCFFRERSRSKAVFGFACTYFCMGARRRWMLWMIDNGIHDFKFLLCASIYTCRWGLCDSRLCHAAAQPFNGAYATPKDPGARPAWGRFLASILNLTVLAC